MYKKSKYLNKKVEIDGFKFDSISEGEYYTKLKLLKRANEIKDFYMQVPFRYKIEGKLMFTYKADFVVVNNDLSEDILDVKAFDKKTQKYLTTPVFNLKKKILKTQGIIIKLVHP